MHLNESRDDASSAEDEFSGRACFNEEGGRRRVVTLLQLQWSNNRIRRIPAPLERIDLTPASVSSNTCCVMNPIRTVEDFRALANGEKPFCAIFIADWCPDCRVLKPMLPNLEKEFASRYTFATVDWDAFKGLSDEYSILGIPSLVSFHRGDVIGTLISEHRKTRQQISAYLADTYRKIGGHKGP